MSTDTVRKGLMTTEQFAETIGLAPSTVRQWVWRRKVPYVRVGRAIRFRPETAQQIIERGTMPALEQ
jgi:excisionase family DNA binding protein